MTGHGEPILYSLYIYAPNRGAPIFFIVTYGLSAVFHIWQCFRYKAWKLLGLHPFCAVLFTAGYALREYGAYNYLYSVTTKIPLIMFVLSQVFIYICPPLLELANYHLLGRLLSYLPSFSPLPPHRVLKTFGGLMALVEALNAVGVALSANPSGRPSSQALGKNLTIAAVAIQVGVIAVFLGMAGVFHWRCARAKANGFGNVEGMRRVGTMLAVLYASMGLIFVRCVYRLVEHAGNTKIELDDVEAMRGLSPLLRYEAYFYVFEAGLMLLNSWVWNIWHPGRFLPVDGRVYLDREGNEVRGEREEEDGRALLEKMGNAVTFGVLFRKKKGVQRIEEVEMS